MSSTFSHLFVIRSALHLRLFVAAATALVVGFTMAIDAVINTYFSPERMWPSLLQASLMSAGIGGVFIFLAAQANYRLYIAKREFERLARSDFQTGLLNRRGFFEDAGRWEDSELGAYLLIADIDHFKRINDEFGHLVGDEVIAAVGTAMNEDLFRLHTCARVGGEEFAIILSGLSASAAMSRADQIRWRIMKSIARKNLAPKAVTISIGLCRMGGRTTLEAYGLADRALYQAKKAGRNCCVMASADQILGDPGGGKGPDTLGILA
jgi:diguanylate cyclase (GGDEF)-like protein